MLVVPQRSGRSSMRAVIVVLAAALLCSHAGAESWVDRIRVPQYFAVSVEDVDRSVAWYQAAFGLRKLDDTRADDDRWRIVNLANDDLFVEVIRDNRDQATLRARGFAKVGFRVPDVDAVADRVEEALGKRPRVLDFKEHGVRILQLLDPDGNIIQLSSPLPKTQSKPQE